tara:strand:+ start:41 stop:1348 length:1308 start_codon:yes stop_codon:yes gene_type:complete
MKRILFILLFTTPFIGFGQSWEKTFGGTENDEGYSVQQTSDGGYIICGRTKSFGNGYSDVYLIKTDENGDSLWTKILGGIVSERGYSVQQTSDGGYIVCGYSNSFGNGLLTDFYLVKVDENGSQLWYQVFTQSHESIGQSVEQTVDGGYILCGGKRFNSNGINDVYLIKTDENGVEQWSESYGSVSLSEIGYSVQQTIDEGYIITGVKTNINQNSSDIYLVKTDENGNSLWNKTIGGINNDESYSVKQTNDEGYIISGWTESFGNGNKDVYLIKTNDNGDSLWTKTYGGSNDDEGYSVQQTNDGGYIITGSTKSFGNGGYDVWLIKTDVNGDSLWTKTYGGTNWEKGSSVQQTNDGGYIICGETSSLGNGYYDVYLIKTDGNGNVTTIFNTPTPSSNRKLEKVVDVLGRETKLQQNTPFIEIYDDGSTEKKIVVD